MFTTRSLRHLAATALASVLLVTGTVDFAAQEASPTPPTDRGVAYPVSIHEGTCQDPVAQPVGLTLDTEVAGYDDEESAIIGTATQPPVLVAEAELDAILDELAGTPHVVAVHASAEAYGEIVACGQIAGYVDDGKLVFGLQPADGSEVSGIAILDDAPTPIDEALEALDREDLLDESELLGDGELLLSVYILPADDDGSGA